MRIANFLFFLFVLQVLLTLLTGGLARQYIWFHLSILLSSAAYFAVMVFAVPRWSRYSAIEIDRLYGQSLLPFLQVTAADLWLIGHSLNTISATCGAAIFIALACLVFL